MRILADRDQYNLESTNRYFEWHIRARISIYDRRIVACGTRQADKMCGNKFPPFTRASSRVEPKRTGYKWIRQLEILKQQNADK